MLAFHVAAERLEPDGGAPLAWLRLVRRRYPGALLALCVDRDPGLGGAGFARRAADSGVRIVLCGEPGAACLRQALEASGVFHVDVAAWLRLRIGASEPSELAVCETLSFLLSDGPIDSPRLDGLPRLLRRAGLPRLGRWRMLRNVLPTILELQGRPSLPVAAVTARSPYAERRSFDGACMTLTGLTARALGQFLGWEAVLERVIRMGNDA